MIFINSITRFKIGLPLFLIICLGCGNGLEILFVNNDENAYDDTIVMSDTNEDTIREPEEEQESTLIMLNDPGSSKYTSPYELIEFNNKLYFRADDGIHGPELWCYY